MRAMKNSGIEWIGEIPQEWKVPPLRSKYAFSKGLSITKADLVDEGMCVISYGQIHSKDNIGVSVRDSLIRHLPANHGSLTETAKANVGDLIFADTSEDLQGCGNCVFVDRDDVYAGYHTLILRPKEIGLGRYYAYLFAADAWRAQVRAKVSGVKLFSITQDILKSTALLEPPKEEQERIVDYLDSKCAEIDALIAAKEKTNALLKERRQSIIYEAVTKGLDPTVPMKDSGVEWIGEIPEGWKKIRAKYVAAISNGSDPKEEGDNPVYGSGSDSFRTCGEYKEGPAVLIGRKGATLHIPHYVEGKYWNVDTAFDVKTDKCKYLLKYYYYASICFDYKLYISTTTLPSMTQTNYGNMFLPLPSVETQQKIIDYIEETICTIDSLIVINESAVQKLKEYRQSLIYEAVTGKVEI